MNNVSSVRVDHLIDAAFEKFQQACTGDDLPEIDGIPSFLPDTLPSLDCRPACLQSLIELHAQKRKDLGEHPHPKEYLHLANGDRYTTHLIDQVFQEQLRFDFEDLQPLVDGEGAQGSVYLATDRFDRKVVVKVLKDESGDKGQQARERFLREIRILGKVGHDDGVIGLLEVGRLTWHPLGLVDRLAFTMEYAESGTLAKNLHFYREPDRAACLVRDLALTAHRFHENGIVHRDLKDRNIFVTRDGVARIGDFGLALDLSRPNAGLTAVGEPMGTPSWRSPELARGERGKVDRRTDVYSLTSILYRLISKDQRLPPDTLQVDTAAWQDELDQQLEDVDASLRRIIRQGIDPVLDGRFQNADELADALQSYLDQPERKRRVAKRTGLFATASILVAVIFSLAAVVILTPQQKIELAELEISGFRGPHTNLWNDFPWEQSDLFSKSYLQLQPTPGQYRYVLAFDGRDAASLYDETVMNEERWQWQLTGPRVDTVILLIAEEPLVGGRADELVEEINTAIPDHDVQAGTRIQWGNGTYWVEKSGTRPRGQPRRAPQEMGWTTRVVEALNKRDGIRFHGWTFRINEETP